MPERDLIEQLDRALAGRAETGPEVTELVRVAAMIRDLAREEFRNSLKKRLMSEAIVLKEKTMATPATVNWLPAGFHSITSYLHVPRAANLPRFLADAFGAEPVMRVDRPDGSIMHSEFRIGDSIFELTEDPPPPFEARPVALHHYVPDVDAAYAKAIAAGATSLRAPADQDYGDRDASIKDPAGNFWYLGTHKGASYIPEGLRAIMPYLHLRGTPAFIDFLVRAFSAQVAERHESPDGTVVHAKIRIGDSIVEMSEAHGEFQPMPAALHFYVPNIDQMYAQAIAAGAVSISEPADQPYGDRYAGIADDQGNRWYLATHIKDVTF